MGHAVLHAAALIRLRPTASLLQSPLQMVLGYEPDISHLRTFGCAVQVPIAPLKRTKMGPQCRLGIYVGFNLPSIIRFLEPTTSDLFTVRFADCHFNETMFHRLGHLKLKWLRSKNQLRFSLEMRKIYLNSTQELLSAVTPQNPGVR